MKKVKKSLIHSHQSVHKYLIYSVLHSDYSYEVHKYRWIWEKGRLSKRPEITLTHWYADALRLAKIETSETLKGSRVA